MDFITKTMFPGSRLLTHREAPGILACVENIAKKAGCSAPPVYLFPHPQMNAAIYPAGQCMLIFGGSLRKTGSTLAGKPSPMLEKIIAHEMGHWSNGWKHFGPMLGIIGGSALIASASVYLYDRTQKKYERNKKEGKETSMREAFHETVEQMQHKSYWQNFREYYSYHGMPVFSIVGLTEQSPDTWGEYFMRSVKNMGAQALGLAVALPLTRPFALKNEYEADAFAAKITKDPEGYVKFLEHLHGYADGAAKDIAKRLGNPAAGEATSKTLGNWMKNFLNETVMAHPSHAERVSAIRKLAPTLSHLHL